VRYCDACKEESYGCPDTGHVNLGQTVGIQRIYEWGIPASSQLQISSDFTSILCRCCGDEQCPVRILIHTIFSYLLKFQSIVSSISSCLWLQEKNPCNSA